MGQRRWRPQRLAEKLLRIRKFFDLSQPKFLKKLELEGEISYNRISEYERDKYDPPLPVLVEYARVAGVHLEDIADDRVNLPEKLPGDVVREAWSRPRPKRKKKSQPPPKRKKKR